MYVVRWLLFLCLIGYGVVACDPTKPGQDGEVVSDASPTDKPVTPTDTVADTKTDAAPPKDEPAGKSCNGPRDCPDGDCQAGKCVKAEFCSSHDDCPSTHLCFEDTRCVKRCEKDTECLTGNVCIDGICHKPKWKTAKPPYDGTGTKKPLRVGMAVVKMDFPMGISMAGFGFRPGSRGPYASSLGASTGMYDRFDVKVIVLDNGVEQIVLVRSPLVFTTDYMVTQIAQSIIEKEGVDLSNKILMTSTHSHSAPARFWNLLPKLNFGSFGGGDFLPESFRRLRDSFVNAIVQARKNLQDGKIGYVIDPNFDPENVIFSDRRGENAPYKEPRLLVMKVEKADGTPLAVLVNYPMHGIISSNTMLTNDASGGLEFKLQDRLEALEKKRIEVFFMQGAAGDVSPRGDRMGHKSTQQMQMLGHLASNHIEKLYKTIKTSSDIDLEFINRRVPITYQDLGYKTPEFHELKQGEKKPYRYGAFQCVGKGTPHDQPPKYKDGEYGCLFSVEVLHNASVPQFSKTRLSALRIGGLVIATFPGENTSHIARRLREEVEKKTNGKLKDIIVMGYSQDHQLYIVGEKDWKQGGYEASTTIWGPKVGEYLLKNAIELTSQLATTEKEKNDTGILPIDFYGMDLSPNIPRKETPNAGKIATQPPKEYKLMEPAMTFTVNGGFQGVDNPHVVLQRENNGKFEDVKRIGGRLYDEFDYRMMMTFEVKGGDYLYTYHFMELEDFPTGTYRFRVEGTKWEGGKRATYTVNTDSFAIVASDKIRVYNVTSDGKTINAWFAYPAGSNDDGKSELLKLERAGHRLRSPLVPWQVGGPIAENAKVEVNIKIEQGGKEIDNLSVTALNKREKIDIPYATKRGKDGKETTDKINALASGVSATPKQALAAGTYQVTITIKDQHGNTGSWSADVVVK